MGDLPSAIGPYRVARKLGEGGMGAVYEAIHQVIQRRVAIKVLHPEAGSSADAVNRFINEARAANLIRHPGLVQITDFGNLPNGSGYLVMEYLDGESLADRLDATSERISPEEVVQIGIQIASALAACHKKGIIHRDLKPGNVMLVPDPAMPTGERLKVLDFGLAKLIEVREAAFVKTHSQAVLGTPLYMSPEQCEGAGRVDAKTDVYALGCILYEMLAGRVPFVGEGPGQVLGKHMFKEPEPLAELAPQSPAALNELVHRLLIKAKDERPSMREAQKALEALAATLPLPRRRESAEPSGAMNAEDLAALGFASTLGPAAVDSFASKNSAEMGFAPTMNGGAQGLPGMVQKQPAEAAPLSVQPKLSPSASAIRLSRRTVLLGAALFCALVFAGLFALLRTPAKSQPAVPPAPVPAASPPPVAAPAKPAAEIQAPRPKAAPEPKKKTRSKKKPSNGRILED
jgi:serine/threonine protein kinase